MRVVLGTSFAHPATHEAKPVQEFDFGSLTTFTLMGADDIIRVI